LFGDTRLGAVATGQWRGLLRIVADEGRRDQVRHHKQLEELLGQLSGTKMTLYRKCVNGKPVLFRISRESSHWSTHGNFLTERIGERPEQRDLAPLATDVVFGPIVVAHHVRTGDRHRRLLHE